MSLYVLDIDILSLLQESHPAVVRRVAATPANQLSTTILSVEEQISGWYRQLHIAQSPHDLAKAQPVL